MKHQQEPSRLESLPGELRNQIWRLVAVEAKTIDINRPNGVRILEDIPPLAAVNRRIRSEVIPIYFAENKFNVVVQYAFEDKSLSRANKWVERVKLHVEYINSINTHEQYAEGGSIRTWIDAEGLLCYEFDFGVFRRAHGPCECALCLLQMRPLSKHSEQSLKQLMLACMYFLKVGDGARAAISR